MITIKVWLRGGGDLTFRCTDFSPGFDKLTGRYVSYDIKGLEWDLGIVADDISAWKRIK